MINQKNTLVQINISKGGVPKLPIEEAIVTKLGIVGDKQKDLRYHGGPERAISIFSVELIQQFQLEGHPILEGSTGENLTISFPEFHLLYPGIKLQIGNEVQLKITSYAAPCKTIKSSFLHDEFIRMSHKVHPNQSRLYASVLKEGSIRKGDKIQIIQ